MDSNLLESQPQIKLSFLNSLGDSVCSQQGKCNACNTFLFSVAGAEGGLVLMKLTGVTIISSVPSALAFLRSGLHVSVVCLHPAFVHALKRLSVLTNMISSYWPSLTCDVIP